MIENNDLLLKVCNIAIQAGEEILKYYNDDIEVTHKGDSSPLTKADLASNKIMCLQPILEGNGVFLKKINRFVNAIDNHSH